MSFTVVPLHNLELPAGSRIPFGKTFVVQDVPEWLKLDQKIMDDIGRAERSKIVHGRWDEGPEIESRMADTEAICRTVIRHILEKPGMLNAFVSPKRDDFPDEWVKSKSFAPPPFPN